MIVTAAKPAWSVLSEHPPRYREMYTMKAHQLYRVLALVSLAGIGGAIGILDRPDTTFGVRAQSIPPTATPHMTCLSGGSLMGNNWILEGLLVEGENQSNMIRVPNLQPICRGVALGPRSMHTLVNHKANLIVNDQQGNELFRGEVTLRLNDVLLVGPDCTSQVGYSAISPKFGRYELTVQYQCCFSCYQTATPPATTATPATP